MSTHMHKPTRQETFYVDGTKVVLKARATTYMRNHVGFRVWVTFGDHTYCYEHINALTAQDAMDKAYVKYVQAFK